jgi:AcrR family transcriptional regulator
VGWSHTNTPFDESTITIVAAKPMNQRNFKKAPSKAQLARARQKELAHREQKEKMLAAAAQLFGSHGFRRTTLDQVAAGVRLTKPRLYFHFKNKQKILEACIERALLQWKTVIAECEGVELEPGGEAVGSVVERYADVAFGDFGLCLMRSNIEYLDIKERDILLGQKADIDVRFDALMAKAVRRRSRSGPDPDFLWLTATILVHGIALLERPVAQKRMALSRAMGAVLAGSGL